VSIDISAVDLSRLSVGQRLALIEQIWDTLPESVDPADVPDSHRAILAQRRAEADANPTAGIPWRDALDRFKKSP